MADLHVEVRGSGERVVLVHGSSDPDRTWSAQRELAQRYELVLPHRRGYGLSGGEPGFDADAGDVADLLGDGAHLVGFSYGGIGSLLAAARRPAAVRSVTVIEPPAFGVAGDHPAVRELLPRLRVAFDAPPAEFAAAFAAALGFREAPPPHLAAAIRRERPPWEAELPFVELARAPFPKLVVSGGWSAAFDAVCAVLERELAAERAVFAEHRGHAVQHAPGFNALLERFWAGYSSARIR